MMAGGKPHGWLFPGGCGYGNPMRGCRMRWLERGEEKIGREKGGGHRSTPRVGKSALGGLSSKAGLSRKAVVMHPYGDGII